MNRFYDGDLEDDLHFITTDQEIPEKPELDDLNAEDRKAERDLFIAGVE